MSEILSAFRLVEENREWMRQAACRHRQDLDFFPEKPNATHVKEVLQLCAGCKVRQECLNYANKNGESYGIWGGMFTPGRKQYE